ncbi:TPA: hypothetical protein N6096_004555, partial [Escherichia coli]|nr:hypothetical protein [Escherichia coli]
MESNIKGLVAAGHEMASELKAECGAVDMRSVAKLISDLATQLEVQLVRANALAEDHQRAIESIKQWRETYGPGSNVVLPAEEAEELARIALASLEAEPVAWTDEEELRDVRKYGFGEIFQCPPDKYADPRRVISLYRELPAPVVPDDWQLVPKKITLEMECALSKADSYEIGWLWALAAAPKYEVQNAKRVQNALNA